MTTDHDLEALKEHLLRIKRRPVRDPIAANLLSDFIEAMDEKALLSMLSTRAVTQPTKEDVMYVLYEQWCKRGGHNILDKSIYLSTPSLCRHDENTASAILALPGLSLTQGSGEVPRSSPGDRRMNDQPFRCHEHERRNMPFDLRGEHHFHKRKGQKWPAKKHRRHGDPTPNAERFKTRIDINSLIDRVGKKNPCQICDLDYWPSLSPAPPTEGSAG